ncbi:hypothetical protein DIPPA_33156 [Diplonema papillatum]|nr:hypothetical protein DIPPA_33156 [Diplonema papillatum]
MNRHNTDPAFFTKIQYPRPRTRDSIRFAARPPTRIRHRHATLRLKKSGSTSSSSRSFTAPDAKSISAAPAKEPTEPCGVPALALAQMTFVAPAAFSRFRRCEPSSRFHVAR